MKGEDREVMRNLSVFGRKRRAGKKKRWMKKIPSSPLASSKYAAEKEET
jgi:hypothetical protein